MIAVGQQDGGVAIWTFIKDQKKFKHSTLLWGHEKEPVEFVAFHGNGDFLASSSFGLVNIWSLSLNTVIQTIKQEVPVTSLAWMGRRRLVIANEKTSDLTVVLMPTNYDDAFNLDNIKASAKMRTSLMGKADKVLTKTKILKHFLGHLASLIQIQRKMEERESKDQRLLSSSFMRGLVEMADVFGLNLAFKTSEVLSMDHNGQMIEIDAPREVWGWLIDAIRASQAIRALQAREDLTGFALESVVSSIDIAETKSINWKEEYDVQLIQWHSEQPNDWQVGGENSGYLFGNGNEGQLADAETHDERPCLGKSFKVSRL